MREALIKILEATGYPASMQGTIGEYPESFYTFWNYETPETYYDNNPVNAVWGFWIYFFSTDPALVESETSAVIARLRAAGWTVAGRGEDALSDEPTHTGRRLTIYKKELY
jgi:hypothetical protein